MTTTVTNVTVQGVTFGFTSVASALATSIATAINGAASTTTTILSSNQATTIPAGNTGIVVSPTVTNTTLLAAGSVETLIAGNGGLTFNAPTASNITMLIGGVQSVSGAGTNAITIGGGSTFNIVLTQGTNNIQAAGSGTVQAGSGANAIITAIGTAATSYVVSDGTADVIHLGAGAATVSEYGTGAVIYGGAGNSEVGDVGADDTVYAGSGSMTLTGGRQDLIYTQTGTLTFFSDGGLTTVDGGGGADTIVGTDNSGITYVGTAGLAYLLAGSGSETLNASSSSAGVVFQAGSAGSDLLLGGAGDDTLFGGAAEATLNGGASMNVYEFVDGSTSTSGGVGNTTILGFKQTGTVQDAVGLFGYGTAEVTNALASATVSNGNTTITLADGSTVTFEGQTSLNPSDFFADIVPCYATGTRIATPAGEVPVESLGIGDHVLTIDGAARRVRWIGHRRARCRVGNQPIMVHAHAFGPGLPRRHLILSPDHSIFVEGVLIPIKHLVNGASISPYPAISIEYWHIELDDHDIILAEGLPAETYLDTGNRAAFNTVLTAPRHPDYNWAVWETLARAPLVVSGPIIDRIRNNLAPRRFAA